MIGCLTTQVTPGVQWEVINVMEEETGKLLILLLLLLVGLQESNVEESGLVEG